MNRRSLINVAAARDFIKARIAAEDARITVIGSELWGHLEAVVRLEVERLVRTQRRFKSLQPEPLTEAMRAAMKPRARRRS